MRRLVLLLTFAATLCLSAEPPSVASLAWMAGHWSSESNGVVAEEIWSLPAGGMLIGMHRDVKGTRASFEFMRIVSDAEGIVYLAQPSGRPATAFRLVEQDAQRAVFANPQHDFPQRITYWRDGTSLCAKVEGPMNGNEVNEQWCWTKR
jgi:hypothetical protein